MSPIPLKIRKILNADPYMKTCVICKSTQHKELGEIFTLLNYKNL